MKSPRCQDKKESAWWQCCTESQAYARYQVMFNPQIGDITSSYKRGNGFGVGHAMEMFKGVVSQKHQVGHFSSQRPKTLPVFACQYIAACMGLPDYLNRHPDAQPPPSLLLAGASVFPFTQEPLAFLWNASLLPTTASFARWGWWLEMTCHLRVWFRKSTCPTAAESKSIAGSHEQHHSAISLPWLTKSRSQARELQ